MKTKEKITIEDFGDTSFKTRVVESENEQKASFTHYLHNHKNGVSKSALPSRLLANIILGKSLVSSFK